MSNFQIEDAVEMRLCVGRALPEKEEYLTEYFHKLTQALIEKYQAEHSLTIAHLGQDLYNTISKLKPYSENIQTLLESFKPCNKLGRILAELNISHTKIFSFLKEYLKQKKDFETYQLKDLKQKMSNNNSSGLCSRCSKFITRSDIEEARTLIIAGQFNDPFNLFKLGESDFRRMDEDDQYRIQFQERWQNKKKIQEKFHNLKMKNQNRIYGCQSSISEITKLEDQIKTIVSCAKSKISENDSFITSNFEENLQNLFKTVFIRLYRMEKTLQKQDYGVQVDQFQKLNSKFEDAKKHLDKEVKRNQQLSKQYIAKQKQLLDQGEKLTKITDNFDRCSLEKNNLEQKIREMLEKQIIWENQVKSVINQTKAYLRRIQEQEKEIIDLRYQLNKISTNQKLKSKKLINGGNSMMFYTKPNSVAGDRDDTVISVKIFNTDEVKPLVKQKRSHSMKKFVEEDKKDKNGGIEEITNTSYYRKTFQRLGQSNNDKQKNDTSAEKIRDAIRQRQLIRLKSLNRSQNKRTSKQGDQMWRKTNEARKKSKIQKLEDIINIKKNLQGKQNVKKSCFENGEDSQISDYQKDQDREYKYKQKQVAQLKQSEKQKLKGKQRETKQLEAEKQRIKLQKQNNNKYNQRDKQNQLEKVPSKDRNDENRQIISSQMGSNKSKEMTPLKQKNYQGQQNSNLVKKGFYMSTHSQMQPKGRMKYPSLNSGLPSLNTPNTEYNPKNIVQGYRILHIHYQTILEQEICSRTKKITKSVDSACIKQIVDKVSSYQIFSSRLDKFLSSLALEHAVQILDKYHASLTMKRDPRMTEPVAKKSKHDTLTKYSKLGGTTASKFQGEEQEEYLRSTGMKETMDATNFNRYKSKSKYKLLHLDYFQDDYLPQNTNWIKNKMLMLYISAEDAFAIEKEKDMIQKNPKSDQKDINQEKDISKTHEKNKEKDTSKDKYLCKDKNRSIGKDEIQKVEPNIKDKQNNERKSEQQKNIVKSEKQDIIQAEKRSTSISFSALLSTKNQKISNFWLTKTQLRYLNIINILLAKLHDRNEMVYKIVRRAIIYPYTYLASSTQQKKIEQYENTQSGTTSATSNTTGQLYSSLLKLVILHRKCVPHFNGWQQASITPHQAHQAQKSSLKRTGTQQTNIKIKQIKSNGKKQAQICKHLNQFQVHIQNQFKQT